MPEEARPRPTTSVKVVVTGPFGVGKTTLIRTLSEIDVLTTERRVGSDTTDERGAIAMDFGRLTIDEDLQLYLFGTGSHRPHEQLAEILGDGLLGYVLLVDHDRPDTVIEAMEVLSFFRQRADVVYIVGVNHVVAGEEERAVRQARHQLRIDDDIPVVAVDARDRESAKALLISLFTAARARGVRPTATGRSG